MTNADKIRGMTNEDAIKYIENHGHIDDVVKDIAINALEKQIPKKMNLDYYCGFKSRECPECGYTINLSKKHNYCNNCGQRLE